MTRCCENIDKKSTLTIIVKVLFCCEIFANDSYAEEDYKERSGNINVEIIFTLRRNVGTITTKKGQIWIV